MWKLGLLVSAMVARRRNHVGCLAAKPLGTVAHNVKCMYIWATGLCRKSVFRAVKMFILRVNVHSELNEQSGVWNTSPSRVICLLFGV